MNKKRLLKLADFLETVPRKAFNMDKWQFAAASRPEGKKPGDCGFAGCAVGWAVHAKLFRGLKFEPRSTWYGARYFAPVYEGVSDYGAAENLFGIKDVVFPNGVDALTAAEYLFSPNAYSNNPTPTQVAKRIRKFVAAHS